MKLSIIYNVTLVFALHSLNICAARIYFCRKLQFIIYLRLNNLNFCFSLKNNSEKCSILNRVLDAWCHEYNESESMLVEGIEHLFINYDLKRTAQKSLEAAIENMKRDPYSQRSHVILFVKNKLLAMCSSRQAQDLSTSDLIFLQLFCRQPSNFVATNSKKLIETHLIFLQGNINGTYSGCIPYIVHISHFNETETFIVLIEYGNLAVSNGLFDVFFAMHKVRILQMQNDMENLRSAYDNLDHFVKQSLDAIKKVKFNNHDIEAATKRFASKWDLLKRKYSELFRNTDKDLILSIESNLPGLNDALKDLFRVSEIRLSVISISSKFNYFWYFTADLC